MDELAERLDVFIAAAVHPDEIAAVLESDGMTDEHIRLAYGRQDSFGLAEELYARVPRSFPEPDRVPDPWKVPLTACLLRGVIFALPGLAYLLGAPLLDGPQDRLGLPAGTLTLLAGALIGWVWDQTLSHRAYSWLGLGDRAAAGRTLLAGAPAGALLGTAAALAVPGGPPSPTPSPPVRPSTSGPPPCCSSSGGSGCCWPRSHRWPPGRCSRSSWNFPSRSGCSC